MGLRSLGADDCKPDKAGDEHDEAEKVGKGIGTTNHARNDPAEAEEADEEH